MSTVNAARKTHLVGAWPGFSAAHAIDVAMTRLGPHLLRLSDGETGERSQWVLVHIDSLRANPDVELVRDGDYSDVEHATQFALRDGATLDPEKLDLGYHRAAEASYPRFDVLRARHGYPEISFQVGLPLPIDLAMTAFGLQAAWGDPTIPEAFLKATMRELELIRSRLGDDVIFQLETVMCMVSVARSPEAAQPELARHNAQRVVELPAAAPAGTPFGLHLCLGDFHHKAMAEMGSARPLVLMINEIVDAWPNGRQLEYIHAPFNAADIPGSFEESWYEPLAELKLPTETRFVAGFVHESVDLDSLRHQLRLIERHAGRRVDIAATCGLGRRPSVDQVWDAMDKSVELIDA
jgi:hypothetical protein